MTEAAASRRRRHLTGTGAHRLSSPGKLQLDVTISPQSHAEEYSSGIDEGMPAERSVKSHRAAHQVTLPPSRLFFLSVIYTWGGGCPLVSSSRHESQPSPLWRLMKLPPARLTARSTLRRLNQQKEKHQWREQHPCVRAFRCGWVGGWVDVFWLLTLNWRRQTGI